MVTEYVYAIEGPEAVKIGLATNPRARLKTLQTGHYHDLALQYSIECPEGQAYRVEQYAHGLLRERRVKGEWFSVSVDEARSAIEKAVEALRAERTARQKANSVAVGKAQTKTEVPWYERWKFHPLADQDYEIIRLLMVRAKDTGKVFDDRSVWTIPKADLSSRLPELKDADFEDRFWLRVFCFWFDYENIALFKQPGRSVCYPKARIFDEIDFFSEHGLVEYAPSGIAALIVAEHGTDHFLKVIRDQSEKYKQKDAAA